MDINSIDISIIEKELKSILSLDFVGMLIDLGYMQKEKVMTDPDISSSDERQQEIALAMRRTYNERILEVIFESPKYRSVAKKFKDLMESWDKAFISRYLNEFDFNITAQNIHGAISNLLTVKPDDHSCLIGFELPGYSPLQMHTINEHWQVRPISSGLLSGLGEDSVLVSRKWIPSRDALDDANGFLIRKTNNPYQIPSMTDPAYFELLLLQLSPLVARSYKNYIIIEHNITRKTTVSLIPSQQTRLRLRIPVAEHYKKEQFIYDISWLLKHIPKLTSYPKVRIALERYALALKHYASDIHPGINYDEAIHYAVIGLETLLISANTEVTYRFQTVLSRLIPENLPYCREFLKRIYVQRSQVAHDGQTSGKYLANSTDVFQAISLLNASIRWYLEKSDNLTAEEIKVLLADLPFGFSKDIASSPWGTTSDISNNPPSENGPWLDNTLI
ncbi:MAG: hypothetical protein P4L49_08350 [Desulfosporosinus sp.]|nr:hypothetical protein [Desulfosporosinus sp.]